MYESTVEFLIYNHKHSINIKRGIIPPTKIEDVLCAISKLSTLFCYSLETSLKKLYEKSRNDIKILVGQAVLVQNNVYVQKRSAY